MARTEAGLKEGIAKIAELRKEFWKDLKVTGTGDSLNTELERAGHVADFIEFGELMCKDALLRDESCGGHYRVEHNDAGEAKRNDDKFCHAAVWEYTGEGKEPVRHIEQLEFKDVHLATRSYK